MKKRRQVYIKLIRNDSWGVHYVHRTKGQRYLAAGFYAKDHSLQDVQAWVSRQPNLELVSVDE